MAESGYYTGPLSRKEEWHALAHGLYDGMRTRGYAPKQIPENSDIQAEPHYYKGGYAVGTFIQAVVVVGAGLAVLGSMLGNITGLPLG